jgi:hypothetical protein
VTGFSSTFSLPTCTRPANSRASCSTTGAIAWQGPHHGAHRSTSTGSGERSTWLEKLASVIVRGSPVGGSGALHRPQTGASPLASFACGMRLPVPHAGHWIIRLSGMVPKVRLGSSQLCVEALSERVASRRSHTKICGTQQTLNPSCGAGLYCSTWTER